MKPVTLFQKDSKGNTKVWKISVSDKGTQSEILIESGRLGGSLIKNTALISEGKNAGKANETTHYTQAVLQAEAKVALALRKGYVYDIADAKGSEVLGSGVMAPMLAHKYHPIGAQKGSKTLKQLGLLGKKIYVQKKLDGNRCTIEVGGTVARMFTRKGDLMPVQLQHILNDVISKAPSRPGVLDGELFTHEIPFNKLNGLIKRQTATPEQEKDRLKIKFHLYDIMSQQGYKERKELLKPFASENIIVLESIEIIATDANIQAEHEKNLAAGEEGTILRTQDDPYENKRSWSLLKFKDFQDSEFKLVGFEEDVRGGFVGAFIIQLPKPITDTNGRVATTFKAGASGQDVETRTYMWNHQSEFLGKMATVEYFGWEPNERPRFGKFKGIRENGI